MVAFALDPNLILPPPLATGISAGAAHGLCLAFSASYVGSLYVARFLVSKSTQAEEASHVFPPPGHRDHPGTMRRRMVAVTVATKASLGVVLFLVKTIGRYGWKDAIKEAARLTGLASLGLEHPLGWLLAPTLFLGPLYAYYLDEALPWQSNFEGWHFGLVAKRNYVVGPITEELLFRSAIISACILGHLSPKWLVFGTPLWFGLAHIHHAWQAYKDMGSTRDAAIKAVGGAAFQTFYTTLFGWYASYVYIRTGSIIPSIASHMFCNAMGIYFPHWAANEHPKRKYTIYGLYLAGIAAFSYGIRHL